METSGRLKKLGAVQCGRDRTVTDPGPHIADIGIHEHFPAFAFSSSKRVGTLALLPAGPLFSCADDAVRQRLHQLFEVVAAKVDQVLVITRLDVNI